MSECSTRVVNKVLYRWVHFPFKLESIQFEKCHESFLLPAVVHNVIRSVHEGLLIWCFCGTCVCVYVRVPGPQTVDLMPVCSRTGTLLIAPSICCMKTSQSRSNKLNANLSDTWGIKYKHVTFLFPIKLKAETYESTCFSNTGKDGCLCFFFFQQILSVFRNRQRS